MSLWGGETQAGSQNLAKKSFPQGDAGKKKKQGSGSRGVSMSRKWYTTGKGYEGTGEWGQEVHRLRAWNKSQEIKWPRVPGGSKKVERKRNKNTRVKSPK